MDELVKWYLTGIIRSILFAAGAILAVLMTYLHNTVGLIFVGICISFVLLYTLTMLRRLDRP